MISTIKTRMGKLVRSAGSSLDPVALWHRARPCAINLYHCCVHKTASQWVRGIFADPRMVRRTGLKPFHYQNAWMDGHDDRPVTQRRFERPLPRGTIGVALYLDYACYTTIDKPTDHRAFFVMRDPRDIVVSWYFSARHSHPAMGEALDTARHELEKADREQGLRSVIDHLSSFGLFQAMRSWTDAERGDENVIVMRYEDLTGSEGASHWRRLLDHCRVRMPDAVLCQLLEDHSFKKLSGRNKGKEDVQSHLRKGVVGDWQNVFTDDTIAYFNEQTSGLVNVLGYQAPTYEAPAMARRAA